MRAMCVRVVLSLCMDGSARDSDALLLAHCGSAISDKRERAEDQWTSPRLNTGEEKGANMDRQQQLQTRRVWMDVDVLMCACSFPELCTRSSECPVLYAQLPANRDLHSITHQRSLINSVVPVFIPDHSLRVAWVFFMPILLFWSPCMAALHISTTCHLKAYLYAAPATTSFCTN